VDTDDELKRAKWLLGSLLVFFISCFYCYDELLYLLRGKTATATIGEVYEVRGRRGSVHLKVEYTFSEADGTARKGADNVSVDWTPPSSGSTEVDYIAGNKERSRLAGNVRWVPVSIFFISIAFVAFTIFQFWREAHTPIARSSGRRTR